VRSWSAAGDSAPKGGVRAHAGLDSEGRTCASLLSAMVMNESWMRRGGEAEFGLLGEGQWGGQCP